MFVAEWPEPLARLACTCMVVHRIQHVILLHNVSSVVGARRIVAVSGMRRAEGPHSSRRGRLDRWQTGATREAGGSSH